MKQYKIMIKSIENAIYTIEAVNESSAKSVAQDMFDKGIKPMVSYERAIDSRFIKIVSTDAERTKYKIYTEARLSDWIESYVGSMLFDFCKVEDLAPIDVWDFWVQSVWDLDDWRDMPMSELGKFILEQVKYTDDTDECVISLQNNLKQVSKRMSNAGYYDWYEYL